jgi:Acetyltransferases
MGLTIRPFNQGDVPYLRTIELQGYENPWTDTEISNHGRCIAVAAVGFRPRGYCAIETLNQRAMLLRLVVDKEYRRQRIGSRLMNFALTEVSMFSKFTTLVPESNLPAQCFLRAHNWKCVNVMKKHFDICGQAEDGFYFIRKLGDAPPAYLAE